MIPEARLVKPRSRDWQALLLGRGCEEIGIRLRQHLSGLRHILNAEPMTSLPVVDRYGAWRRGSAMVGSRRSRWRSYNNLGSRRRPRKFETDGHRSVLRRSDPAQTH